MHRFHFTGLKLFSPLGLLCIIAAIILGYLALYKRPVDAGIIPSQLFAETAWAQAATGPLRINPANPRYFTDGSGRAVYLTGSHTWGNFQDIRSASVIDYSSYLNFLVANHHTFFRLWTWEQVKGARWTTSDIGFDPLPYQRTGPGVALDGLPKFDVAKFNQAYFDRLRARIIQARERGIYVSVMLFNGFSIDDKGTGPGNAWPGHPFNKDNNLNGIDGDPNHNGRGEEIHTLAVPAVTAWQEAYVRKVIDTVNDLDNVLYEISNESPSNSQAWQYHMIELIKSYEASKPKQHPVGMGVEYPGGNNAELFASPADWISPNEVGGYKDNPPAADGRKVIILDTDHLWGEGGDRQWVWKSFTRGYNMIYMDCYATAFCENGDPAKNTTRVSAVANMGYTAAYAARINLVAMTPQPALASTGYCLAIASATKAEYLVYLPAGGTTTVDLSATSEELLVEWLNPSSGRVTVGSAVAGGASRSFSAPFSGDAVLYVHSKETGSGNPISLPFSKYVYLPFVRATVN